MKTSQLEEAEEHAQAGKEPTGSLKTSGHDHQELIQESIESSANNSMGAALDKIRQKLTSKDTRGARGPSSQYSCICCCCQKMPASEIFADGFNFYFDQADN